MKTFNPLFLSTFLFLTACASLPVTPPYWSVKSVSRYASGYPKGTEIISVQRATHRAAVSIALTGEVDILDIGRPDRQIRRISRFNLELRPGEELTSVAFHPSLDLFAAAIDAGIQPGRLEIRSAKTGRLVCRLMTGFGPDAVVLAEDGKTAVIANEGEDFSYEPVSARFFKPEGSLSIVRLDATGHVTDHKNLKLAYNLDAEGGLKRQGSRLLEREIDWDGDGKISATLDFDHNGVIENKKVLLGRFEDQYAFGNETAGEKRIVIPVRSDSPSLLEPEYIAISPDGRKAYVTLQEANAVAVVDLVDERITNYYALGASRHAADMVSDGEVKFDRPLTGLREPDGIALAAQGRYFVTADEGDTEASDAEQPMSGGRTVSVFDAATGALLGDTGNQVDELAFANMVYPEHRSHKKGAEPEMLVSFDLDGAPFVAVGLERAGSVELISLVDPYHPKAVALGKIAGEEEKSPEGIAHFMVNGEHYLLTANEMNGTVESFKIVRKNTDRP